MIPFYYELTRILLFQREPTQHSAFPKKMEDAENIPLAFQQLNLKRSSSQMQLKQKMLGLSPAVPLDPNCVCKSVFNPENVQKCLGCGGDFEAVLKLVQERSAYSEELGTAKVKLEMVLGNQEETAKAKLKKDLATKKRLISLQDELEASEDELAKVKLDMEIMGQKLIDEIEKRAEIQHASENVNSELEELTQTLFEEANNLVANEARERHGAQELTKTLSKQLKDSNMHLLIEQSQTRELRLRISRLEQDHEVALIAAQQKKKPILNVLEIPEHQSDPYDLIHPLLLIQFEQVKTQAPKLKLSKLHELLYMRNALEDDVSPCLRFGGDPRTSTKKFIDAIMANTCFIEEMSEDQIEELMERDKRSALSSQLSLEKKAAETPTTSLFNKTMLERITNALTAPLTDSNEKAGCSTCGKDEPYQFRFKISDVQQDVWYPICLDCRCRLLSVVAFYQFIRNMRQGLFTSRNSQDLYLEALSLKRGMFYTRIGTGSLKAPDTLFRKLQPVLPNSSIGAGIGGAGPLDIDLAPTPKGVVPTALSIPKDAPVGFTMHRS